MSVTRIILRSPLMRRILMVLAAMALLVSLLRLVSPLRTRSRLQHRLSSVMDAHAKQKRLHPLFVEMLNADQADAFTALVTPATCPLRQEEVATVSASFEKLALEHGFAIGKVGLRMISDPPQRLLAVALPLDGRYDQFGTLLKALLLLPSLESLDRITVQLADPVDRIQVDIKLALE